MMESDIYKFSGYAYNLDKVKLEVDYLTEKYDWKHNRLSLQSPTGNFYDGVTASTSMQYKETEYTQENLPPEWEISKFIRNHDLYRARIVKLNPKSCYGMHQDKPKHMHLAVITHPNCKLIVDDIMYHIPADGCPYMVDTTKHHTALNASIDLKRIHIIGCIK